MKILIFFSYLGSNFRGAQRNSSLLGTPVPTVQGTLEEALSHFLRNKDEAESFPLCLSSRTDASVHAFRNSAHISFKENLDKDYFLHVNKYLFRNNLHLCINEAIHVPETLHARFSAKSRTYLYRFGVQETHQQFHQYQVPSIVSESGRSYIFGSNNFDFAKAQEALKVFDGVRDYGAFIPENLLKEHPFTCTTRRLTDLEIKPVPPLMKHDLYSSHYQFYEFKCTSKTFLKHMVRKIVSVIIAVGVNRINLDDVKLLFEKPVPSSWLSNVVVVPGCGLYLLNVSYSREDLILENNTEITYLNTGFKPVIEEKITT